jgi:hypothetical protein
MPNTRLADELRGLSSGSLAVPQAQRILRAAQKGITPIRSARTMPIVPVQGAPSVNANYASASAPKYVISDSSKITVHGGPLTLIAAPNYRIAGYSSGVAGGAVAYSNPHGGGFGFASLAQKVGLCGDFRGGSVVAYLTDLATGIRLRHAAADFAASAGLTELSFDLGARPVSPVFWEIYPISQGTVGSYAQYFTGVNVPETDSIWAIKSPDQGRLIFLGDSWFHYPAASSDGGTNPAKLGPADYIAEGLGSQNYSCPSIGGTGVIATNSGTLMKYRDRVQQYGDIDVARIGVHDAVITMTSLNDFNVAGNTPAAIRTEYPLLLAAIRAAQPTAIIFVLGPQLTTATSPTQDWWDATKNGVADYVAASSDQNVFYIDNSPAGGNYLFGTSAVGINSIAFNGTGKNHLQDAGIPYWGSRVADDIKLRLRSAYSL